METITATAFQKNIGSFMRKADKKPLFISQHGEPRAVIMGVSDFADLLDGRMASLVEQSGDFLSVESTTKYLDSLAKHA